MIRLFLVFVVVMSPAVRAQREAEAAAAEARAFKATEEERWCDAVASFLEADSVAPVPDLLFNAARAAEVADDRVLASKLYAELIKRSPKAANVPEAKKRAIVVNTAIKKDGPGLSCAEQAATKPSNPPPTVVANPTPTPTPVAPMPTDSDPGAGMRLGGIVALSSGAVLLIGGGAAAVFAGLPYLEHNDVATQIRAAEAAGAAPSSVDALQERQRLARNSWDGFGQLVFPIGVAVAAVGVASLVTGAVLVPLSMGAE